MLFLQIHPGSLKIKQVKLHLNIEKQIDNYKDFIEISRKHRQKVSLQRKKYLQDQEDIKKQKNLLSEEELQKKINKLNSDIVEFQKKKNNSSLVPK